MLCYEIFKVDNHVEIRIILFLREYSTVEYAN